MFDFIKENKVVSIIIAVVLIAIIVCVSLLIYTHDEPTHLVSKRWERTIFIEDYDWKYHKHSGSYAPAGARNVRKWTEIDTYTTTDSKGNTITKTDVDHYVSYEIQEWEVYTQFITSGINDNPYWSMNPLPIKNIPTRFGDRKELYVFKYMLNNEYKDASVSYDEYKKANVNDRFIIKLNGFGFVVKSNRMMLTVEDLE